ncbi:MAG TPA: FAD-dependent oxidoreductase [Solirubrobacteraceae bacterium]|nr:FAD-dependent oxidoreductase [Solirubrobacteraceae bacterium]
MPLPSPWPQTEPSPAHRAAYADAEPRSFWLDSLPSRAPHEPLDGRAEADLCVIGGGYTGLWAALAAKHDDPAREVIVLEATRCGNGASGRNGGFLEASLTHGLANGLSRFPDEIDTLERLADDNFAGLRADLARHDIACDYATPGVLSVALEPRELEDLREEVELVRRYGHDAELLDAERTRAEVNSPMYLGAVWDRTGSALVHPGRLADGLRAAAHQLGVRIHELTPVRTLHDTGSSALTVSTEGGVVTAPKVLMATSAYPPLVRAAGRYIAPVYDYALMTEPLSDSHRQAIGWNHGQGISDLGNQFHYYRPTADGRILFGGYDAVYRYGGDVGPHRDTDDATFGKLSQHFFTTFPQLEGVRFTHRWGGAIDTCSRFSVFFGNAFGGRLVYALGYTGLGVGATRFGARVALDLLDGKTTPATQLTMVRRRPLPFPPEPLRSAVIQLTRNRLAAADRNDGRRGLWLRTLDRLGLGFDS